MNRTSLHFFGMCIIISLFVIYSNGISQAHVSEDSMPDSVAEVEYNIYLEFRPDDKEVLNKLGMVYYRQKKLPEALKGFSRVLQLEPDNYDALDGMGLVKAAQQEYDEAIRYHQQAIAINAKDMMGYYHLGVSLEKKGLLSEALESYRTSLAKFNEQYPSGTENKKAAEFEESVKTAIRALESKL